MGSILSGGGLAGDAQARQLARTSIRRGCACSAFGMRSEVRRTVFRTSSSPMAAPVHRSVVRRAGSRSVDRTTFDTLALTPKNVAPSRTRT